MSIWSRRVKNRGLKSSVEVQLPTVSGYLKKMLYSCLCATFVGCYCVLMEKIDGNGNVVTIDNNSHFRVNRTIPGNRAYGVAKACKENDFSAISV